MARSAAAKTVWAAIIGNLLVTATKTVAALMSGSSGMLSEALHSFVDTANEVLLLYGMRRSRRTPDPDHPFGFGREVYFWSFIVALLLFGLGCVASIAQGINHIRHPAPIERPVVVFIVLALSFLFEGSSWLVAWKGFRQSARNRTYLSAIEESKDPPQFVVLLEDTAALIGIVVVALGTGASLYWNEPTFDGGASIVVGILLGGVAVILARESKALLIGERADETLQKEVLVIARSTPGVAQPNGVVSAQLSPDQVVVALSVEFDDQLRTPEIERIVMEMETRIRQAHPQVFVLYVKPQTAAAYVAARQRIRGEPDVSQERSEG